jgi:serine/threonine protein kinase
MGIVFQAEDPQLKRQVAIKALKPSVAYNEMSRRRFFREAEATAHVEHDHIVTIYHVGEERGVPYLTMKLLQGESLDDRLKREGGWLALSEVLRIGREICEGLAVAHDRNLIHRDIKPANIWLEAPKDRVKILDFGLARINSTDGRLTPAGTLMGTPAYMAPEQASGDDVDRRCDLFSVGCVLYRMCTGQLPFKGKDTMAMLMALASQTPDPPHKIDPGMPLALSDLIMRLLSKDPDGRPRSAQEVAKALEEIERKPTGPGAAVRASAYGQTATQEPEEDPLAILRGLQQERRAPDGGRSKRPEPNDFESALRGLSESETEPEADVPSETERGRRVVSRKRRRRKRQQMSDAERKVMRFAIIVGIAIVLLLIYLLIVKPFLLHAQHEGSLARPTSRSLVWWTSGGDDRQRVAAPPA